MSINEIIVYIMVVFMVLGAIDKIIGNKFGLGEKFDEGFMAMGSLAIAMVGVVSLAPVLATILKPVIVPVYTALGADPAMFATTLLACDMGGYPLALQLAQTEEAGLFAGLILGSMMGPTIVFTIPVALGIIQKEDFGRYDPHSHRLLRRRPCSRLQHWYDHDESCTDNHCRFADRIGPMEDSG